MSAYSQLSNKSNNNVDLTLHNDVWAPEDLRVGDIISCMLNTYIPEEKATRKHFRNAIITGFQVNPLDFSISGLHVVATSKNPVRFNEYNGFTLSKHHEKNYLVSGMHLPTTIDFASNHFVTMDAQNFSYWSVVRQGRIEDSLLPEIFGNITEYQKSRSFRETDRKLVNEDHLVLKGPNQNLDLPNVIPNQPYSDIPDSEIQAYRIADAMKRLYSLSGEEVTNFVSGLHKQVELAQRKNTARAKAIQKIMQNRHSVHVPSSSSKPHTSMSDILESAERYVTEQFEDEAQNPTHRDKCNAVLELLDKIKSGGNGSLQDEFDESRHGKKIIELPSYLWQGRYISMRINDICNESVKGNAFRPCAVWRVFEDKDSGEIAGMELHPCTRGSADRFTYKMQANPLYTKSLNPGFLIADCIIRLPFNPKHFQDSANTLFNELPNDKFDKFKAKREYAHSSGSNTHVYGLQEVPDNWVEREMPERPRDKKLEQWRQEGLIKIDDQRLDGFRNRQNNHKEYKDSQPVMALANS